MCGFVVLASDLAPFTNQYKTLTVLITVQVSRLTETEITHLSLLLFQVLFCKDFFKVECYPVLNFKKNSIWFTNEQEIHFRLNL